MTHSSQGALALSVSPETTFQFESQPVRIVLRDSEPWFVAADLCMALQLGNPTMAMRALDEDEKALSSIEGISRGNDQANIVSESGLYTLVLRCRDAVKPGTVPHRFRKWVTHEVLPAIRKTGRYSKPDYSAAATLKLLESGRWLMSIQNGNVVLNPVDPYAFVVPEHAIADIIREPGTVSLHYLPEIIAAASERLSRATPRQAR